MITLRYLPLIIIAGSLGLAPVANGQAGNANEKATGSISGRIMVDGKGAAGIVVAAFDIASNRRVPSKQTRTDGEGRFQLAALAPSSYQVLPIAANLTAIELSTWSPFVQTPSSAGKSVLVSAGEDVSGIDLAFVRGGVITGRITSDDNKPVVEETVTLLLVKGPNSPANQTFSRAPMYQTDDRGVYRIYGLPAGKYKVSVGRDAAERFIGSNRFYPLTYYPDVIAEDKAELVEVSAGAEARNINIHVGHHEDTYSVSGRVVDGETGAPVSGTNITLMSGRGSSSTLTGDPTAADGKFYEGGLAPGRYGIYVNSDRSDAGVYSDPIYFDVIDKDLKDLEVKTTRGLTISGSIAGENMELKDLLTQLPELQVHANVLPADMQASGSTIRSYGSGNVETDGGFKIKGLRPGRAQLSIYNRSGRQRIVIVRVEKDGAVTAPGFEITAGQSVAGVRIFITFGTGMIRGTVKFEGGSPPDGYETQVSCVRAGTQSPAGGAGVDARGRFVMTGLAPASYECRLEMFSPLTGTGLATTTPQKKLVTVVNGAEAELNFVVDLSAKEVGP